MAFTCRFEAKHEETLERICKRYGIKTKAKGLLLVLEQFEKTRDEREHFVEKCQQLERELSEIKTAVRRKLDADSRLAETVK